MLASPSIRLGHRSHWPSLLLVSALLLPSLSSAQPVIGARGHFDGISLDGWTGGSQITNPGTGGLRGPGDGFLQVGVPGPFAGNLGAFAQTPDYAGDWTAAGITQVRLWLNDVNGDEDLELHFSLGNGAAGNFWQCNTGFIPPHGEWAPFTVELNSANFTFTGQLAGTFAAALHDVDRILVRHDKAPYVRTPDAVVGDFGLDEVLLTNGTVGVAPNGAPHAGSPVRLAPPGPNPSRGAVQFRLWSPAAERVRMQVVDAMGRIVRHAEFETGGSGDAVWVWDGADDAGRPVAAGAYRVRAIGPGGGMSQPVVRVN